MMLGEVLLAQFKLYCAACNSFIHIVRRPHRIHKMRIPYACIVGGFMCWSMNLNHATCHRPGALGLKLVRPVMGVATYLGRVREGDTPSAQLGGMGDSPIGVWGGAPGENAFLR